jgi:hypothetical protein
VFFSQVSIESLGQAPYFKFMKSSDLSQRPEELPPHARRAVFMIRLVMAMLILLPFVLVWLLKGFRF